jgi:hypothetical protein
LLAASPVQAALNGFEAGLSGSATGTNWQLNIGNCCGGTGASSTAASLSLAPGGGYSTWGSALALAPQSITNWTASYIVNLAGNGGYSTLVLQNDTRGALALDRMNDGYTGGNAAISPAYFIGLNASSGGVVNIGLYSSPSQNGVFPLTRNGNAADYPTAMSITTLDRTKPITFTLAYDGTTLSSTASDGINTFNTNQTVNLTSVLGASTAYVGFTGGGQGSTITAFSFSNEAAPPPVAVSDPVILPPGTNYVGTQSVSITPTTAGSTIHYTLDGSTPTTNSPVYSTALTISSNTTVKAFAVKSGLTDSAVVTESYLIAVTAPAFTPGTGTYHTTNLSVTLSALPTNAAIYYTTDLSTPDNVGNGTLYTGPITVSADTTIRAIAYAAGLETSAVSSAFYHLQVAAPVFTPPAGTYVGNQSVALTAVPTNATIYYTTDLSSPDNITGTLYTGPITVAAGTTHLRAIAYADGLAASPVVLATYVVNTNIILQWSAFAGNGTANATETATALNPGLAASSATLTRGSGLPLGGYGWNSANGLTAQLGAWPVDLAAAVANNVYAQVVITPNAGKSFSLSNIGFLAMDGFGTSSADLLYSTDGFATPGTSLLAGSASGGAGVFNSVNVSTFTALQNAAGPVTFRVYFHGSATAWDVVGLGGSVGNVNPAFSFEGTIGTAAIVPLPAQLTATASGGNFSLSFASQTGINYTLQSSTNLTDWSAVTNWTGTGGTILYSVPVGTAPKEFYRVVIP